MVVLLLIGQEIKIRYPKWHPDPSSTSPPKPTPLKEKYNHFFRAASNDTIESPVAF
jgi:hypothetical protein